jgi:predicted nucleic acid-binding protein
MEQTAGVLRSFKADPNFSYWPITTSWTSLVEPFRERIYGHRHVTDAFLLGLAIKEHGVLVTLDKALRHLAGPKLSKHVLVLE